MSPPLPPNPSRRQALWQLGVAAVSAPVLGAALGCAADVGDDGGELDASQDSSPIQDASNDAGPSRFTDVPAGQCAVYPEQTEGPFFFDAGLVRRDITGGKSGAAWRFFMRILEADACTPIRDAVVHVWHADAGGLYSGYTNQGPDANVDTTGQTFLRGSQVTGDDGIVEFVTIFPGWYPGRTTHIHVKVLLGNAAVVTSQAYFPDATSSAVYATGVYAARGDKDTTNTQDGILQAGGGNAALVSVNESVSPPEALLTITVMR